MVIGYSLALLVALGYASTYEGLSFTYWGSLKDSEVEPIMVVVPIMAVIP